MLRALLLVLLLAAPVSAQQALFSFSTPVSNPSPQANFDVTVRVSLSAANPFPNGIIAITNTVKLDNVGWVTTSLNSAYQPLAWFVDTSVVSNVNGDFVFTGVLTDYGLTGNPASAYFFTGVSDLFHHTLQAGDAGTTGTVQMEDDFGNSGGTSGFELGNSTNTYVPLPGGGVTVPTSYAIFSGVTATHTVVVPSQSSEFIRGDANGDAVVNLADAVAILGYLFPGMGVVPATCLDALDADDSGGLQITDAIVLLNVLFPPVGTTPGTLPPPNVCGIDPTGPDVLQCDMAPCP